MSMDKRYDPKLHEDAVYQRWETAGVFNPDSAINQNRSVNDDNKKNKKIDKSIKKSFSIAMPPPNANDPLHIGHALFLSIEDILIRYHRMLGDDTLWIPGTDHAGIETQFVFEKKLKKQGKSRFDFDRQTLYDLIWNYVQENSDVAVNQMKKIGASADWSRFRFMLDPEYVSIVLDTFIKLHTEGLIYRDYRLVNYSPSAGTSYSELEINYQDATSALYYIRYQVIDAPADKPAYIVVATTRPEPIFADTHLAIHPDNPKTAWLKGKQVKNPLTGAAMTIIEDSFVDPEFGTGIVKLTPAHDATDFEVAKRHNLPLVLAITTAGRIVDTPEAGELAGLKVAAARKKVIEILETHNAIERIDEKYQNRVATDYKTGQPIEPLPLAQFFIQVKPLVTPILTALDENHITVHGAGHDKILRHWLESLRDWNISRQIVWGIRIPVWYNIYENPDITVTFLTKEQENKTGRLGELLSQGYSFEEIEAGLQTLQAPMNAQYTVSKTKPDGVFLQETDTFDTWFSSAQWPFATLQSLSDADFERFYPTQVMETGYDILPFWVMRMLLIGNQITGKLPFKDIYLHGLVRDQHGKKMSKSKGNVLNPLEIIDQYGADALRMALVIRSSAGLDKSIGHPDFKAMRNLTNKLWNATRFISFLKEKQNENESAGAADQEDNNKDTGSTQSAVSSTVSDEIIAAANKACLDKMNTVVTQVTQQIESYKFGLAAETLHTEFWHWFCDEAIEEAKEGRLSLEVLSICLQTFLKLFHPFMPFVTEVLWQTITQDAEAVTETENSVVHENLLATQAWPDATLEDGLV